MTCKYCFFIFFFFTKILLLHAQGESFDCDGSFYMSQRVDNGNDTELYIINVGNNIEFSSIGNSSAYYNSIGYNVVDNYIYGIDPSDYQIYRIGRKGEAKKIGVPSGLNTEAEMIGAGYLAGDVSLNGEYVVMGQVSADYILRIDVATSPPQLIAQVEKKYADNNLQTASPSFSDIAFDPLTEACYGFDQTTKRMANIDIETGLVDVYGMEMPSITSLYALFFNSIGQLFAYGLTNSDGNARRFYLVDKTTGNLTELTTGPPAKFVDGCSCPFAIGFKKIVDTEQICAGQTVTYTFSFINNSGVALTGLNFQDVLTDDMLFVSDPSNLMGGEIISGTGKDHSTLEIKDLSLPVGSSFFTIDVKIPYHIQQKVSIDNQASLDNLPEPYSEKIYSDNPDTFIPSDPTPLTVLPPPAKINVSIQDNAPLCEGETLTLSVTSNSDELFFLWKGPDNFSSTDTEISIANVNELNSGIYTLTASIENCWDTLLTNPIEIICLPKIIGLPVDTILCNEETALLTPTFEYTNSIEWQNGSSESTYLVEQAGWYVVTAENDCGSTTDSVQVIYEDCVRHCTLFFPEAFTPNNDGQNDAFTPITNCQVSDYRLSIFDRWGKKIFETTDHQNTWTGESQFQQQPIGVYVWVVEGLLTNDFEQTTPFNEHGHIMLMR